MHCVAWDLECLPNSWKNRLIDSCSKWDASNPERKVSRGSARSICTTFSRKIGSKAIKPKGMELANGTCIFHSEIPFGNFGVPFKKSRFPEKISVRVDKNFFIYIPSEIAGILGKWLTTLMSNHVVTPTGDELVVSTILDKGGRYWVQRRLKLSYYIFPVVKITKITKTIYSNSLPYQCIQARSVSL